MPARPPKKKKKVEFCSLVLERDKENKDSLESIQGETSTKTSKSTPSEKYIPEWAFVVPTKKLGDACIEDTKGQFGIKKQKRLSNLLNRFEAFLEPEDEDEGKVELCTMENP